MFRAAGEAEALAAALDAGGLCDGVATTDCDALLWGARTLYRTLHLNVPPPPPSPPLETSGLELLESCASTQAWSSVWAVGGRAGGNRWEVFAMCRRGLQSLSARARC